MGVQYQQGKSFVKIPHNFQYGYYVFLGIGDYHQPAVLNSNWIATWGIDEWKIFLKNLTQLKATTLMVYLMGHFLPYKSDCYPEIVASDHPNVKNEFFSKIFSLATSSETSSIFF